MRHRQTDEVSVDARIQHSLKTVFTDEVLKALKALPENTNVSSALPSVVEKAADSAVADIRKSSFITFDLSRIIGNGSVPWVAPYEGFATVGRMLDELWFRMADRLPPYEYGAAWVLRDTATGKHYGQLGSHYAKAFLAGDDDDRSLAEVGLHPGMRLEAIPL